MLTIFTPTYNRRDLLTTAYTHLLSQTSQDFVWLIVDDGSTDGTGELVQQWIAEDRIRIRYVYQQNGGKMRAHNRGVELCDTELFVCVDSDDYLVEDAVENIVEIWDNRKRDDLAGLVGYKGQNSRETMQGESFPAQVEESTLGGLYKAGFFGETTLIYRTDVLKRHQFPEFPGEKFVPEAVIYDEIDAEYKLSVVPRVFTISRYQPEGLTRNIGRLREKNPQGWLYYYQRRMEREPKGILRYKYIAHGIRFTWKLGQNIWKTLPVSKWEIAAAFPAAVALRLIGKM